MNNSSKQWDSFPRYLSAKKTVDDRALNLRVWQSLVENLPRQNPLRILEVGGGIGTMVERIAEWGFSTGTVHYTLLDANPANIAAAKTRLSAAKLPSQIQVEFVEGDMLTFAQNQKSNARWDVLIAHAVLDLVDVRRTVPQLLALLQPDGCFYFTLNFDGVTTFEPEIDAVFETHLMERYHRTMDERKIDGHSAGESRMGRRLLSMLPQLGGEILAAGASDWVVFPQQNGYFADEAYFLHFIIDTVRGALADDSAVDGEKLSAWAEKRHAQIGTGDLIYIAHQIDITGKRRA